MSKVKKKGSKKSKPSRDLLDTATVALKKFRRFTKQAGKLSTTQKVVGGIALLAAGLTYLATQSGEGRIPAASEPDQPTTPKAGEIKDSKEYSSSVSAKETARPKRRKLASSPAHPPFSEEAS